MQLWTRKEGEWGWWRRRRVRLPTTRLVWYGVKLRIKHKCAAKIVIRNSFDDESLIIILFW